MKMFKNKENKERELPPFMVKQINTMNATLLSFNKWLQKKSNNYSFKQRKVFLIIFCFLFISDSTVIIYKSLEQNNLTSLFITPIHAVPLVKGRLSRPAITVTDFNKIKGYKNYLDSMHKSILGKPADQNIYYINQHLMDTIQLLENLYHEQSNI